MDSKPQFGNQQKYRKFISKNDLSFKSYSSSSFQNAYTNQTSFQNPLRSNNEINSTSADSYSYQNSNPNYEKPKIKDNVIILRPNEFVDIEMNLEEKILKKITLNEYFESFIEGSFQCLNIPFLDKKGNLSYNIFNPTLSSMNLVINKNKNKIKNINQKYLEPNFSVDLSNDNLIKIEFDETNPPYNREIIEKKIKIIHKLLGVKDILLDDIDKEKSFFSILWTPADTYKIKSSFLSVFK